MNARIIGVTAAWILLLRCAVSLGQEYCPPDHGEPGDEMIQAYLAREANQIHAKFLEGIETLDDWQARPAPVEGRVLLHAGPFAHAREDAAARNHHRHARTGRLHGRHAALPKPAAVVRHRQPVPARHGERGRAAAGGGVRVRAFVPGPARQQDGVPVARHLVCKARVRLPRARLAAVGRDRGDPSRHLPREPLVVALAGLHAGRRRVPQRDAGGRLPDRPARRRSGPYRGDRHQRRRRGPRTGLRPPTNAFKWLSPSAAWPTCRRT